MKPIVAFDFDGVIHSYTSGWRGVDNIPDPPVPGIKEAIQKIRGSGYEVVVFSSRCSSYPGMFAIDEWLDKHNIQVDNIVEDKPQAIVTIDDRAICFDGDASTLLDKIKAFKPWYK